MGLAFPGRGRSNPDHFQTEPNPSESTYRTTVGVSPCEVFLAESQGRGCRSLSQKTASPPQWRQRRDQGVENVGSRRSLTLRFTDPGAGNLRSHTYLGDRNACNAGNALGTRPIRLDHHRCHRGSHSPRLSVRAKVDLCGRAARVRGRAPAVQVTGQVGSAAPQNRHAVRVRRTRESKPAPDSPRALFSGPRNE